MNYGANALRGCSGTGVAVPAASPKGGPASEVRCADERQLDPVHKADLTRQDLPTGLDDPEHRLKTLMTRERKYQAAELAWRTNLSEEQIQLVVFQHITKRGVKGLIAFHPKNGGVHQETARQRLVNSQMGVLPGVPDVILYLKGQLYCLELKTLKGKLTAEQQSIGWMLRDQGAKTGVAFGLDDAIAWLERHELLKGNAI